MRGAILLAAAAALAGPQLARAQDEGNGFLFGTPHASLSLRGGLAAPEARGDVFQFVTRQFTLGRNDFRSGVLDADLGFRLSDRVDLALVASYARSLRGSEFRDWVDNNNQPIEQSTSLARVPLTASLKLYLAPRGRSIGSFAWIPARVAPYVTAGGGVMWYRFMQEGDFIDFGTKNVFPDKFTSSGWTPTARVAAGADYSLNQRLAFTGEGRYDWARARLGRDFVGFDRIDLSGFALALGFTVRL